MLTNSSNFFSIGDNLHSLVSKWNNSEAHSFLGPVGARIIGVPGMPIARITDVALRILIGTAKVVIGTIGLAINGCASLVGKKFETNWTITNGLANYKLAFLFTVDAIVSPFSHLFNPNFSLLSKKTESETQKPEQLQTNKKEVVSKSKPESESEVTNSEEESTSTSETDETDETNVQSDSANLEKEPVSKPIISLDDKKSNSTRPLPELPSKALNNRSSIGVNEGSTTGGIEVDTLKSMLFTEYFVSKNDLKEGKPVLPVSEEPTNPTSFLNQIKNRKESKPDAAKIEEKIQESKKLKLKEDPKPTGTIRGAFINNATKIINTRINTTTTTREESENDADWDEEEKEYQKQQEEYSRKHEEKKQLDKDLNQAALNKSKIEKEIQDKEKEIEEKTTEIAELGNVGKQLKEEKVKKIGSNFSISSINSSIMRSNEIRKLGERLEFFEKFLSELKKSSSTTIEEFKDLFDEEQQEILNSTLAKCRDSSNLQSENDKLKTIAEKEIESIQQNLEKLKQLTEQSIEQKNKELVQLKVNQEKETENIVQLTIRVNDKGKELFNINKTLNATMLRIKKKNPARAKKLQDLFEKS